MKIPDLAHILIVAALSQTDRQTDRSPLIKYCGGEVEIPVLAHLLIATTRRQTDRQTQTDRPTFLSH